MEYSANTRAKEGVAGMRKGEKKDGRQQVVRVEAPWPKREEKRVDRSAV